ncbi:MAG TPA: VTT domain-containing protein [Candidatus Paceibacterota bacterium]|nr:VTT domain-containing protein [Candidatus Paceibacterota bacterium]
MSAITQAILPVVLLYKYWALFGITFVAALIVPIPPGTLIMASAAFSYQGYFSFGWVIAVSALGNILGDNAAYWLARQYGRIVLSRIGFRKLLASRQYQKVEARITRHPGFLIFISRFEVTINLIVNIVCGIGKVSYLKYLLFESMGEIV